MKILATLLTKGNYYLKYFCWMTMKFNKLYPEHSIDVITLDEYLNSDQSQYNVLIYNTFANDKHRYKFDRKLTSACDDKFKQFTGFKILFDNHDDGAKDGFERLADCTIPRIKANPDYRVIEKFNVIMTIPFVAYPIYCEPQNERNCQILCSMRTEGMPPTRQAVKDRIKQFNPLTDKLSPRLHAERLCRTLINIVPTGNGSSSRTHTDTLSAGALLLAEEGIENIKLLPNIDLIENEHFVTFNLDSITNKLETLLNDRKEIDRIRENGHRAFIEGYNMINTSNQLFKYLYANT